MIKMKIGVAMAVMMAMTIAMVMVKMTVIRMMAMMMTGMLHLFKTRRKSLLNIFTVSEAIVQVSRVVLASWRACEQQLTAVAAVGEGL